MYDTEKSTLNLRLLFSILSPKSETCTSLTNTVTGLNQTIITAFCYYYNGNHYRTIMSRVAQSVLQTGWPGFDPRQRQSIFPLPSVSRPALGPTQPPTQWVTGALSPGVNCGQGVILTTHTLLVPRLRKSGSYTSSHPNAPLWSITGPPLPYLTLPYRTIT
jgi:hypothetical protein